MNKRKIKTEVKSTPNKSKTRILKGVKQDNNLQTIPVKTFGQLGGTFEESKSQINMKHHLAQVLKFKEEGISEVSTLKEQIRKFTSMVENLEKENEQLSKQLQGKRTRKPKKKKNFKTLSYKDEALSVIKLITGEEVKIQRASSIEEFSHPKSQNSTKSNQPSKDEPKIHKHAFCFFSMVMRPKIKQEENLNFGETSKRVGQLWQNMDENARKPYSDLSAIDLKRYRDQINAFKAKGNIMQADLNKSPILVLKNHPKMVISAYKFFSCANLPKLMKDKQASFVEASKENGEIWKKMSDKEKQPFIAKSKEDRMRREDQLKELKSNGYFTLSDGTQSCGTENPKVTIATMKKQYTKQIRTEKTLISTRLSKKLENNIQSGDNQIQTTE